MAGNPAAITHTHVSIEQELHTAFGNQLQRHVPLAPFTTLKIGGPAEYLLEVHQKEDLVHACRVAQQLNIPFYFLAGCSNVLIDDHGLRGLVVLNRMTNIIWGENKIVQVDGGYSLDRFVLDVSNKGWADLSFAAGIPGSVGGAVIGGAGAFGHLVHEYVLEAEILQRSGEVKIVPSEALGIHYRTSEAKKRGDIILSVRFGNFTCGDVHYLLGEIERIKAERERKHPQTDFPSAGSFFKNLPPNEPKGRRIPAGKLLDEVGAKELRVGGAGVFAKHANIIVNYGGATAAEVNELANEMAKRVREKFGIELEREVQYLW